MSKEWKEPAADTRFMCGDGVVRTWGELVAGIDTDIYPICEGDYTLLLWCYDAEPMA